MIYIGESMPKVMHILSIEPSVVCSILKSLWNVPNLSHLRLIGCLCYAIDNNIKDKFSPRSIPYALLGYANNQKEYKLLSLSDRKTYVSRYVQFQEQIFPFGKKNCDKFSIFQISENYDAYDKENEDTRQNPI